MKECALCFAEFVESLDDCCSERCANLLRQECDIYYDIKNAPQTADTRVFFYDVGFGELCDRMSILMLRRAHQTDIQKKLETDFLLGRVKQSIQTKLNRNVPSKIMRDAICNTVHKLFKVNAIQWRLRSLAMGGDLKSSYQYVLGMRARDEVRNELDAIIEGRSRIERVY